MFILSATFSFFGSALFLLTSVTVTMVWHLQGTMFGLQQALAPLGTLLTSIVIVERLSKFKYLVSKIMCIGFAVSGFAVMPTLGPAVPLFILEGVGSAAGFIGLRYLLRVSVPPELQGRVCGAFSSVGNSAYPLGRILGTSLANPGNAVGLTAISGGLFGLVALMGFGLFQLPYFSETQKIGEGCL